ncbi:MAG TPA: PD-(D/E)XK nuclease family protein [Pyrinomonadaceae bacterium]
MIYLLAIVLSLVVIALLSLVTSSRAARRSGLPSGQLIYSDTGFAVGHIAPTTLNEEGVKQERPLVSARFRLTGRPDYLVRTGEGIIPIEAKSTILPANGKPYNSHVMQLAAYCLLVEDVLGENVPYGVVRYANGEVAVDYTPELREELIALLEEMSEARLADDVHRSHSDARRCKGCSMRESCDEALKSKDEG